VASYRARIFCEECNTHFKHLEDATIPFLEPMGKDISVALRSEEQDTLALWGAKTAYALLAAGGIEDVIPAEHLRLVRYEGRVSDDCWVGYCPWDGDFHKAIGDVDLEDLVAPTPRYQAYQAILTFARVFMKVIGFVQPVPGTVIDGETLSIKQVWPKQPRMLVWPPQGPPATNATLPALAQFVPLRRV
jgi:hypothetical protein